MRFYTQQHQYYCGIDLHARSMLRTVPGIGKILSLVILYEIHDINCSERRQELTSYAPRGVWH
jgi:hypothetical protein